MMEEKVKKRGWIKNAAIIFLSVMLVLTFFSNTIMNRSLPEAATQCITSGTIETKVRGTGTVTAKENYDVIIDQTRKVLSVPVRVGHEVSVGDVLFTLEPGDSQELEEAREALDDLKMKYQRALINATDTDYAKEDRDIALARAALEKAEAKSESLYFDPALLTDIAAKIKTADDALASANAAHSKLARELKDAEYGRDHSSSGSGWSGGGASSSLQNRVTEASKARTQAKNDLDAARLAYHTDYELLVNSAKTKIESDCGVTPTDDQYQKMLPYYLQKEAEAIDKEDRDYPLRVAYEKITAAEKAFAEAEDAYNAAVDAVTDANASVDYDGGYNYNGKTHAWYEKECARLDPLVADAKTKADDAQTVLDDLKSEEKKLQQKQSDYETALGDVETKRVALENLIFALDEQKKADGKTQSLEALDLQDLQKDIQKAEAKVAELEGDTETGVTEVKSKVNGTVKTLNVSAGRKATAGDTLATIEVPDLGYTMSFSVTNEQARKVRVGDTASASNYYWGSQITGVLASIKSDPQNPQTSKLLTFDITGDVSAGNSVTLSVGQKSAQYDLVVPNSAIRTDTNGSFVLVVTVKSSPLGNRYTATRADVQVIASDDLNSAITGAVNQNDYVITTSNKPVANGDLVRLPDNL